MSFSEPSLVTHRHTTPPQQHKPSAGAQNAYSIKTHCRALHDSEYVENNTYDEEAEDDDDRGDFLLEQIHAQEGQQQSCKSGYQGIQVVLHCGDLGRIKGHAGMELADGSLDALGAGRKVCPVNVSAFGQLDFRYFEGEADGNPALNQSAQDEHTQDGCTLCNLLQKAAGQVLGDRSTGFVAELLCIPQERITDQDVR